MRSVYAYIRVSTVKQGERGSSLQEQRSAIEGYASRNLLTITQWFEEKETAAKKGRRVFNQMLTSLRKRDVSGVIIHKIDRSARNLRDWADLGELIDQGIEVHFAHETLDLQSRGGRLSADIQAVVAADYIRNLRDEVLKGFYGRLKQGYFPLPAPIGYLDQGGGKAKILDPEKAPLVRRVFELYASGKHSQGTLLEEIERMGLKNRHGGRVSLSGLSSMLNNEFYIGIIHVRRRNERFKGVHPPLISSQLFETVQQRLSGKRKNQGLKYDFLYRKLLRCAHCGYNLIGEQQKGFTYYRCHTKNCPRTCMREENIADQASDALSRLHYYPEEYDELAKEFERLDREAIGKREDHLKAATIQLNRINERLARLTDAYIDRLIDKPLFDDRKTALLKERVSAQEQIEVWKDGKSGSTERVKEILELLKRLSLPGNPVKSFEIRDMLSKVTSNLRVSQDFLLFDWKTPFGVLSNRGNSSNGGPYRGAPRICNTPGTFPHRIKRGKQGVKKIARRAFSDMEKELNKMHPE